MWRCREKGGKDCLELASKVSITLLRYSDFIPSDKCFYQARGGGMRDVSRRKKEHKKVLYQVDYYCYRFVPLAASSSRCE